MIIGARGLEPEMVGVASSKGSIVGIFSAPRAR
jgi:hypothetical protein